MSMIWNTDTRGMCIVHRAWHVKTEKQFVASLLAVFAVAMCYEVLKLYVKQLEVAIAHTQGAHGLRRRDDSPRGRATPRRVMPLTSEDVLEGDSNKRPAILSRMPHALRTPARLRLVRSGMYGVQVALSCFLMLVMMTYNAWLLGAIVVGAMAGAYYAQEQNTGSHAALCH
ncbi:copper transpport protein [Malassezia caprae]|uniref:Copper transport protein n=1 Tax=Malassezia caprae TaxID=1381934 RepID=A0AAF0IVQ2_9BASI|nr:copper transpport protein [Malassezia caprae]